MRGVNHATYLKHYSKSATAAKPKKKKSTKSKRYPVERQYRLGFTLPSNTTRVLGAMDRDLSRVNHRLYRQSRYYEMKVDIDADLPDGSTVFVYALQDTWMNQKAYQTAHAIFEENSMEEAQRTVSGSRARWNDFRVASGETSGATDADSTPVGYSSGAVVPSGTQYTAGEYVLSEVADASGNSKTFRWVGSSASTFNIIDEYDAMGNTNNEPAFPITGSVAYDGLEDNVDQAQLEHLQGDGNAPPYSGQAIENQVFKLVATLHVDANGTSKLSTGFFTAPCGIYTLAFAGGLDGNTANDGITITAKAGDYKGVAAMSMLE